MTKIIILAGGNSNEREVSLRSGAAVTAALQTAGYDVSQLDTAQPGPDYKATLQQADLVFPVLHGSGGEDGEIQAWLEAHGINYIGTDANASAHCFDKWRYKQTLQAAGFVTPAGALVDVESFKNSPLVRRPFVLKPYNGGSSIDTFIVRDVANYDVQAVRAAFQKYDNMLLEELIEGQEITIGILLEEALPVIEIIPPTDGEFDYDNKYNGHTQELCPPQHVSQGVQQQAQTLALQIHRLLKVRDMSRTDMMVAADGTLYVLETNTIPGMTSQSLLPKAALTAGYDMPTFVTKLVEAALQREHPHLH